MTMFTFLGCSFTVGVGLDHEKDDFFNYTNLVSTQFDAQVNNLAISGNSNYRIFIAAINELLFSKSDILFVQWSALNRLWLYPSPDTELMLSLQVENDYNYRGLLFSKKELQKVSDCYHLLNHDYHNLLEIINYSKILQSLTTDTRIVFINGLLPWTVDISKLDTANNYSKKLSAYSKEILDFDNRNDIELNKFFTKLNLAVNSLDQHRWVNMFESFKDTAIDAGNDNRHPGPNSHQLYANKIINYLNNY